jgi:hypothetical protein
MKRDILSATIVTTYLVVYTVLFHAGAPLPVLGSMFLLSPFLVLWMVYSIIKHGVYKGKELEETEEWGYADKERKKFLNKTF